MKYIKLVTRIDKKLLDEMSALTEKIEDLIDDLHEVVEKNEDYTHLLESAKGAWAGLSDFLDEYEDMRY